MPRPPRLPSPLIASILAWTLVLSLAGALGFNPLLTTEAAPPTVGGTQVFPASLVETAAHRSRVEPGVSLADPDMQTAQVVPAGRLEADAIVLHAIFGETWAAQFFAFIYLLYLPLTPITLIVWLVWSRNISYGYWYATANCLTWTLGTISYYAIPTMGPVFWYPWLYRDLDVTGVTDLQDSLWNSRQDVRFPLNPFSDSIQSVAGQPVASPDSMPAHHGLMPAATMSSESASMSYRATTTWLPAITRRIAINPMIDSTCDHIVVRIPSTAMISASVGNFSPAARRPSARMAAAILSPTTGSPGSGASRHRKV